MHFQPKPITQEEVRTGRYRSTDFAPALWQIPASITTVENPWSNVAASLMWGGSAAILSALPKAGIDKERALLHVGAVLLAVDLTVEHREAAAAFLLSEWFESISTADAYASHLGRPRQPVAGMSMNGEFRG
mgnify:CR=1 FL=1